MNNCGSQGLQDAIAQLQVSVLVICDSGQKYVMGTICEHIYNSCTVTFSQSICEGSKKGGSGQDGLWLSHPENVKPASLGS